MTHKINDRVKRRIDVFDENSPYKYGTVIKCYSRAVKKYSCDLVLGPYPELYEVEWDEDRIREKDYLPHGLINISQH